MVRLADAEGAEVLSGGSQCRRRRKETPICKQEHHAFNRRSADVLVRSKPRRATRVSKINRGRSVVRCCGRGRPHSVDWETGWGNEKSESPYVVSYKGNPLSNRARSMVCPLQHFVGRKAFWG